MAEHRSNFSDNALTTLESLVLECQLENARQHQEKHGRRSTSNKSSEQQQQGDSTSHTTKSHQRHHEMPRDDHDYIATLPGNDQCADCRGPDVEWTSVTYGIMLCTECSGVHRYVSRGVSIPELMDRPFSYGCMFMETFWY